MRPDAERRSSEDLPLEPELVAVEVIPAVRVALPEKEHAKVHALGQSVEERDPIRGRDLGQQREPRHAVRRAVA